MLVKDIMTKSVITVNVDDEVADIARKLVKNHIKGVPVLEANGQVAGMITEADLILQNATLHLPTFIRILDGIIPLGSQSSEEELRRIYGVKARDIMSHPVITVDPEMPVDDLASFMWDKKVNPVPVLENDQLIGIVSRADIVNLLIDKKTDEK